VGAAAAGGRRKPRQSPAQDPSHGLRAEAGDHLHDFLRDFRRKYHANKPAGASLREFYRKDGRKPPPDLPRNGDIELTGRLYRWLCRNCEDPDVVRHLYCEQDRVIAVLGEAVASTFTGNGRNRKRQATQQQVEVQWAPTRIWNKHLRLYKKLGFEAVKVTPCRASGGRVASARPELALIRTVMAKGTLTHGI
jgi:hypothetical protein